MWLITVRFGRWHLIDVFQEWEDIILDSLEILDRLKRLIFRTGGLLKEQAGARHLGQTRCESESSEGIGLSQGPGIGLGHQRV